MKTYRVTTLTVALLLGLAAGAQALDPAGGPDVTDPGSTSSTGSTGVPTARTSAPYDLHLGSWGGPSGPRVVAGRVNQLSFTYASARDVRLPRTAQVLLTLEVFQDDRLLASRTLSQALPAGSRAFTVTFAGLQVPSVATRVEGRIVVVGLSLSSAGPQVARYSLLQSFRPVLDYPPPDVTHIADITGVHAYAGWSGTQGWVQFHPVVKNRTANSIDRDVYRMKITFRAQPSGALQEFMTPLSTPVPGGSGQTAAQLCRATVPGPSSLYSVTCQLVRVNSSGRVIALLSPELTRTVTASIQPR